MTVIEEECQKNSIISVEINTKRGKTPENIQQICLDLCRDYLGGVWLKLLVNEIRVKRLSGGQTNQTYYCGVNEDKRTTLAEEPQEVLIKLYEDKHFNNSDIESNNRLTDTIIALMVSEKGLGPKIYGLFERGQIQKYYKHKNFRAEEQKDPKLMDELARRLARFHAMDVPIKKTGNWIFDFFDESYKLSKERFDIKSLIQKSRSQTLKDHDLGQELEWLKKAILGVNSPLAFTHVDFRGCNIMVTQSESIILCDFEYSCYGFRGYDFGTIFGEYKGRIYGEWDKPKEFPSDNTIKPFVMSYIDESVKLRGKTFTDDERNSFEHILKEVKVFCLVSLMFFVLFTLKMNQSLNPDIPFDKIQFTGNTEKQYRIYHKFKQLFIDQKVFSNNE